MQGRKLTDKKLTLIFVIICELLKDAQRKALITDYTGKSCFILPFGHESKELAAFVVKKNCAICIENLIKSDNEDIYKQTCSIRVVKILNGPAQDCCFKFSKLY